MVLAVVRVSSQHHDHAKEHGKAGEGRKGGEAKGTPVCVLRAPLTCHRLEAPPRRNQEAHGLDESQTPQSVLENIESSAGVCLALT